MTNKEKIQRDIELTFDFVRQIIENQKLAEQLPSKCEIDFIEKDYTALTEKELTRKQLIKVNHTFELVKKKKITNRI